jgi:hypothetical protein
MQTLTAKALASILGETDQPRPLGARHGLHPRRAGQDWMFLFWLIAAKG